MIKYKHIIKNFESVKTKMNGIRDIHEEEADTFAKLAFFPKIKNKKI